MELFSKGAKPEDVDTPFAQPTKRVINSPKMVMVIIILFILIIITNNLRFSYHL